MKVGARLTPPGSDDVFVIGDTALALDANGKPLPGLAPVAKQQGVYVTEVIKARLAGKTDAPPFRYRDRGKLATIRRRAAIITMNAISLRLPDASLCVLRESFRVNTEFSRAEHVPD